MFVKNFVKSYTAAERNTMEGKKYWFIRIINVYSTVFSLAVGAWFVQIEHTIFHSPRVVEKCANEITFVLLAFDAGRFVLICVQNKTQFGFRRARGGKRRGHCVI